MNSLPLVVLIICVATINSQWVIHNQTVINTTVVQHHGFGPVINRTVVQQNHGYVPVHLPQQPQRPQPLQPVPPAYGFRPNVVGYDPYAGHVNRTIGGRHGNDLIVGSPGPNDVILFKQWFEKGSRWLQIREKTIKYPEIQWGNIYHHKITAIGIFDLAKSPGGHASILSGGPGHRNVTIRLFSDRGAGFNFEVIIHGR